MGNLIIARQLAAFDTVLGGFFPLLCSATECQQKRSTYPHMFCETKQFQSVTLHENSSNVYIPSLRTY